MQAKEKEKPPEQTAIRLTVFHRTTDENANLISASMFGSGKIEFGKRINIDCTPQRSEYVRTDILPSLLIEEFVDIAFTEHECSSALHGGRLKGTFFALEPHCYDMGEGNALFELDAEFKHNTAYVLDAEFFTDVCQLVGWHLDSLVNGNAALTPLGSSQKLVAAKQVGALLQKLSAFLRTDKEVIQKIHNYAKSVVPLEEFLAEFKHVKGSSTWVRSVPGKAPFAIHIPEILVLEPPTKIYLLKQHDYDFPLLLPKPKS